METQIIHSSGTASVRSTACNQRWEGAVDIRKHPESTQTLRCTWRGSETLGNAPAPLAKCGTAYPRGLNPARKPNQDLKKIACIAKCS